MATLAQKHFQRQMAKAEAQTVADENVATETTMYEQMLMQLSQHQRSLSSIKSRQAKNIKKAEFILAYQDYLDGVLEADAGGQDDVLVRAMVWHIDCLELERAVELAIYVINHDLSMPDGFDRNSVCVIAEEIADVVLKNQLVDDAIIDLLQQVLDLVSEHDKPDEVQAKLHKAIGLALLDNEDADIEYQRQALAHLNEAYKLDPKKSGVKKKINALEKIIADYEKAVSTESQQQQPAPSADTATQTQDSE